MIVVRLKGYFQKYPEKVDGDEKGTNE